MRLKLTVQLFVSAFFVAALVVSVQATPLMTMGGVNNVGVYQVTDLSDPGDVWDAAKGGYTSGDFSGFYIGTITNDNNDSVADLTNLFNSYLDTPGSTYDIDKIDAPGTSGTGFDMTYDAGNQSGTWSTTNGDDVNFYSVKAGPGYALYFLDPASSSGDWVTRHLEVGGQGNTPAISHLSVSFTDPTTPPPPPPPGAVPEPTTMLLFGAGLIGLVGFRRKFMK